MLDLRREIRECTSCELYKLLPFGCKPVPGIGPLKAEIFIVGEAPGKEESEYEEPFVGMCGQYLTRLLEKAGIDRKQCYISNVVKCRPTDTGKKNRPPSKKEIKACRHWLYDEINIIRPKILVTLGKVAAESILSCKVKKLSDIAGEVKDGVCHNVVYPVICTYHPSFLLVYGSRFSDETVKHLKQVKKYL